jgi:signal transduction histidine kinase
MFALLVFFSYWQIIDHLRHRNEQKQAILFLQNDINAAVVGILNSQPRFGQIVILDSVKGKLDQLMKAGKGLKLKGIIFFNSNNEIILNEKSDDFSKNWSHEKYSNDFLKVYVLYSAIAEEAGVSGGNPVLGDQQTIMSVINLVSSSGNLESNNMPKNGQQISKQIKGLLSENFFKKKTVNKIVYLIDISYFRKAIFKDLILRITSLIFATIAFIAFCYSLFSMNKSIKLKILLSKEQAQNEYLKEMHLIAAGLAHDIKNPLNIVRGGTQTIAESTTKVEVKRKAEIIVDEVDRINSRLNKFLSFSNLKAVNISTFNLKSIISEISTILQVDCEDKDIEILNNVDNISILGDREAFTQIIFNLLHNATKAVSSKGKIQIYTLKNNDSIDIYINDNGRGIPKDIEEDIFKPYFSSSRESTGLGLAIVRHLCFSHGWEINLKTDEKNGTTFFIKGIQYEKEI